MTIIVACVGDSITQLESWPTVELPALLGSRYSTINYGVAGTCVQKAADQPYWNSVQFGPSHAVNPNVVCILLGTNDSKAINWGGQNFLADYEALIAGYQALPSKPAIVVATPPPAGTNALGIVPLTIANAVVPNVQTVWAATGVARADVFGAFGQIFNSSLFQADGVHPNATGGALIAQAMYNAIISLPTGPALSNRGPQLDVAALGPALKERYF